MTTEKTPSALATENETLKAQLSQSTNTIKQLNAQILSCKQMVGEGLDQSLALRSNLHLVQQENETLKKETEILKSQVKLLGEKILELTPAPTVKETTNATDKVSE